VAKEEGEEVILVDAHTTAVDGSHEASERPARTQKRRRVEKPVEDEDEEENVSQPVEEPVVKRAPRHSSPPLRKLTGRNKEPVLKRKVSHLLLLVHSDRFFMFM
jgi:hypothetical protein